MKLPDLRMGLYASTPQYGLLFLLLMGFCIFITLLLGDPGFAWHPINPLNAAGK
jgi:hypothetical protein